MACNFTCIEFRNGTSRNTLACGHSRLCPEASRGALASGHCAERLRRSLLAVLRGTNTLRSRQRLEQGGKGSAKRRGPAAAVRPQLLEATEEGLHHAALRPEGLRTPLAG